jgi:DNA end-binding protein Ku
VQQKVKAGQTETVVQPEAVEVKAPGADIIDLTELLQRSLRRGSAGGGSGERAPQHRAAASRQPKAATARAKVKRHAA